MRGSGMYLSFGNEAIYEDAAFNLDSRDKVGIVGVNGAGKTTFFPPAHGRDRTGRRQHLQRQGARRAAAAGNRA